MLERRQFKRISRPLNLRFSFSHQGALHWVTSSTVGNISVGGVEFLSPEDLNGKVLDLEIQSARWRHRTLRLEGVVLASTPSIEHPSLFEVRVKFIHVSQENKQDLLLLEKDDKPA